MQSIILSPDQESACSSIVDWYQNPNKQYISLAGYAGTGKTTILAELRKRLHLINSSLRVGFCAFTGKASWVLHNKLKWNNAIYPFSDTCSTIHRLIYSPIVDERTGEILGWRKTDWVEKDLLIVDEGSMLSRDLWNDLLSFDVPIIVVGDHGQLPPIGDKFNLMQRPDLKLEKIHRQAEDNPIIYLSKIVREEGRLREYKEYGEYGNGGVLRLDGSDKDNQDLIEKEFQNFDSRHMILAGTNKMRIDINTHLRDILKPDSRDPVVTDRVICLQNNGRASNIPIFNGMCGTIEEVNPTGDDHFFMRIKMDGEKLRYFGEVSKHFFNNQYGKEPEHMHFSEIGDRFDFGYCITVHKAQGSEADNVILFERNRWKDETEDLYTRWLYTGVTRAVENLLIVG